MDEVRAQSHGSVTRTDGRVAEGSVSGRNWGFPVVEARFLAGQGAGSLIMDKNISERR